MGDSPSALCKCSRAGSLSDEGPGGRNRRSGWLPFHQAPSPVATGAQGSDPSEVCEGMAGPAQIPEHPQVRAQHSADLQGPALAEEAGGSGRHPYASVHTVVCVCVHVLFVCMHMHVYVPCGVCMFICVHVHICRVVCM